MRDFERFFVEADETLRDIAERNAVVRPQASGAKALPSPKPLKEGSHLTCRHGRFWRSCQRCRIEK